MTITFSPKLNKYLDTGYPAKEAYKRITMNKMRMPNSDAWFMFWQAVSQTNEYWFNLPQGGKLYDWELSELQKLGYDIRWNDDCQWYDVTVYP